MRELTVLYDSQCALCLRARGWLERQSQYVSLRFVPAGSDRAKHDFPEIDHAMTQTELTVIADTGQVYFGPKAWIMCLWALREYRAKALSMQAPGAWWAAKRLITTISANRQRISRYVQPKNPLRRPPAQTSKPR